MGHTITYNDNKCEALYHNLGKVQRRWGVVLKLLEKTGPSLRYRSMMYTEVLQTVILYGIKSWGATEAMMKVL